MKTYSILGCGWLGFSLAKKFIENGVSVKGSTTTLQKIELLKENNINPFIINIDDKGSFQDFLESDVLLIMITSKQLEAYENLVAEIKKSSVKKVIFISSTSVYPRLNKDYTEKDETVDSLLSKVEEMFRESSEFTTTIIRFAGLYGGKRQPGNWFKDKKIPHPNGFVNMIHREDCISIISEIIDKDVFGETFNACANHHPTRKEYYIKAKKALGKAAPVFDDSKPLQYKTINPSKMIDRLNYQFIHPDLLDL